MRHKAKLLIITILCLCRVSWALSVLNLDNSGEAGSAGLPLMGSTVTDEFYNQAEVQAEIDAYSYNSTEVYTISEADSTIETAVSRYTPDLIILVDEKPAGTHAGGSVANTWITREVNTEMFDTGGDVSISGSYEVTFQPGVYDFFILLPSFEAGGCRAKLINITDSVEVGLSRGWGAGPTTLAYVTGCMRGRFTITSAKTFSVIQICQLTCADFGLGYGMNVVGLPEYYTVWQITKWRDL